MILAKIFNLVILLYIILQFTIGLSLFKKNKSENLFDPLNVTLDMYRSLYLRNMNSSKLNSKLVIQRAPRLINDKDTLDTLNYLHEKGVFNYSRINSSNLIINDYLFERKKFITDVKSQDKNIFKKFHQPKIIIHNKKACSSRKNKIFIVCMIHSHRNNFIRRRIMRDSWLSINQIKLLGKFFKLFDGRASYSVILVMLYNLTLKNTSKR